MQTKRSVCSDSQKYLFYISFLKHISKQVFLKPPFYSNGLLCFMDSSCISLFFLAPINMHIRHPFFTIGLGLLHSVGLLPSSILDVVVHCCYCVTYFEQNKRKSIAWINPLYLSVTPLTVSHGHEAALPSSSPEAVC